MAAPLFYPPTPPMPAEVLATIEGRHRGATLEAVLSAVAQLGDEVRALRQSLEPNSSTLITGGEAMREYRALTTPRT